ncbi:MAG: hypothetical protein AAF939_20860 [Planctomycetota bacterium]
MKRLSIFSTLLIALIAIVGCGQPADVASSNGSSMKDAANLKKEMKRQTEAAASKTAADPKAKISKKQMAAPVAPAPGDEAPEIVGVDLDGEQFKLSDYEGKVVMLDFWGDW